MIAELLVLAPIPMLLYTKLIYAYRNPGTGRANRSPRFLSPGWMVPVELDVFGGKRTNQSRFPFGTYIFLNKISPWLLAGCFPTKIITPRHQFATC